ncbi:translesion error-prone DNA polymerase V autoproteolytic subunit [Hymenobacter sp. BT523]|uniref:LexA family protein n=1 Tax=Hymenobacter sp. BT523 TaxID=2795725 RepID=UPI0018EBCDEE|nr:translesion error-prone DNA polymerase V autoproteolytic subunit [Hymenobacter sp. BT523]MBJ6107720.1 translesion error-prone DNA polymerase V autoproteolytic subunit [Hymenobacter sp. BT523]
MHDVLLIPVLEAPMPAFLPVFSYRVPAGFPSPATDELEGEFNLNQLLFRHPSATYMIRVAGESMSGAEIHAGDLLAVDKHLEADHGHIVVAVLDGEVTVKRLERKGESWWLVPANPAFKPYQIRTGEELFIWGVVTHVVHELLPGRLAALLHSRD